MKAISYILSATVLLLSGAASGQFFRHGQPPQVLDSVITWKFSGDTDSLLSYRITYEYDAQQRMTCSEEFVREQALNLWVPYRIEDWQFDGQDRQTLWDVLYWENAYLAYKGLFRYRYVYDNQGNISEFYSDGWSISPFDWINYIKTLNIYDSQNRLINEVSFEWNSQSQAWDSTAFSVLEYNAEGLLERRTGWEPEEGSGIFYPKLRFDYEYNMDGDMISGTRLFYNPYTQLWYYLVKEEYAYDTFHRKIHSWSWQYEESIEEWIPKDKDNWAWDNAGNMTLYEYYRIGEDTVTWIPSIKSEMIYNSCNRILKNTGYSGNNMGEWEAGYMREYEYLQDTLLIEDALSQWDAGSAAWKGVDTHVYTLDSLNRRHTDSYHKWIVHVQQFVLSTRDNYYYSTIGSHGINEPGQFDLQVWPNPTTGLFNVQSIKHSLKLFGLELIDPSGKVVLKNDCPIPTDHIEQNICNLPNGIYYLRIWLENQCLVRKIIKI
jgi:hypothetical protein